MTSVLAAIGGLTIGFIMGFLISLNQKKALRNKIADWRRRCNNLQEQFDAAKREREQVQKNVDSQLRTKDLQLKQLRDENEDLRQQLSQLQSSPTN